jgi:nucleoid DNA-binding protein
VKQNVLLHQDIKISQGYYRPSQKVSRAAVYSSESQMVIIKTAKIGSFPLPGIEKLSPSKPNSRIGRNPTTGAETKIPVQRVAEMWDQRTAGGGGGGREEVES